MRIQNITLCILTTILAQIDGSYACTDNLKKYPLECQLQDRLQHVKDELKTNHSVNADWIAGYRSQRFIDEQDWNQNRKKTRYMPWKIYKPAPSTWQYWEKGAKLAQKFVNDPNFKLDIETIEAINKEAISEEMMTFLSKLKGNDPGEIRSGFFQAPPGAKFDCDKNPLSKWRYKQYVNYELKDYEGDPLVRNHLSKCGGKSKKYGGTIWYMKSNKVEKELSRWTKHFNENYIKYINNEDTDLSPLEFIAYSQKWFLAIHPFGDGNGRTSRLIQDIFLEKLGLPFMPAGRLEMSKTLEEYKEQTKKEIEKTVHYLEECLKQYQVRKANPKKKIHGQCISLYQDVDTGEYWRRRKERVQFHKELNDLLDDV